MSSYRPRPRDLIREAEAQEELRNPRGKPTPYTDSRQDPEWRRENRNEAIEMASMRMNRNSAFRNLTQPRNRMLPYRLLCGCITEHPLWDNNLHVLHYHKVLRHHQWVLHTNPNTHLNHDSRVHLLNQINIDNTQSARHLSSKTLTFCHPRDLFVDNGLAPLNSKATLPSNDQQMATSQLNIDTMDPRSTAFETQKEWAFSQLRKIGHTCNRGCRWTRVVGGYRCDAGFHWVTNGMLSEGLGQVIHFHPSGRDARVVPSGFPNQPADYVTPGCRMPRIVLPPGYKSILKRR